MSDLLRFKFKIIFLAVLVLILLFCVYILNFKETNFEADSPKLNKNNTKETSKSDITENQSADTEHRNNPETELNAVLEELKPHQFHSDPFIEAKTVNGLYLLCTKEFGDGGIVSYRFQQNQRQQTIEEYNEFCNQAKSRYPKLMELSRPDQIFKTIPTTSYLGEIMQRDLYDYDRTNPVIYKHGLKTRLKAALNSENSVLLTETALMSFMYFQYDEIMPVSEWLNSKDNEYNGTVFRYALTQMACKYQQGTTCSSNGLAPWLTCISGGQKFCGYDHAYIYDKTVMPGMKKDVELLTNYLNEFKE